MARNMGEKNKRRADTVSGKVRRGNQVRGGGEGKRNVSRSGRKSEQGKRVLGGRMMPYIRFPMGVLKKKEMLGSKNRTGKGGGGASLSRKLKSCLRKPQRDPITGRLTACCSGKKSHTLKYKGRVFKE